MDLISRQAAIDAMEESKTIYHDRKVTIGKMQDIVNNLPPVQEQRWIPVTERLPKEKEDVLLAFKQNMIVGFWENVLGDDVTWYANSGDGWMTGTEAVDNDGIPLAWMPLPEPWKGEEK